MCVDNYDNLCTINHYTKMYNKIIHLSVIRRIYLVIQSSQS